MRDIVCDARFYSVTDEDSFWKDYGSFAIGEFIESLPPGAWHEEDSLTLLKEDFLNGWMASNLLPLDSERRIQLEAEIKVRTLPDDGIGFPDPDSHDGTGLGEISLGRGIKDSTNRTGEPADGLPPNLKDYMQDSSGGNSADLHNDGHKANARFLSRIDPSIVRLAEKIGRRGDESEGIKGKFRPATKSDITGVCVGNDLNSLLPSELALLASPYSERIFLDRYVRKRLQTFSSVSISQGEEEKKGPIYICIDTSGSMVDEPEILAKTLALSVSITAQKERRPVCIFNYSDTISFFVLKDLDLQRKRLLRFLSESYGGGNDENKLFRFLFGRMPKLAPYRHVTDLMEGADLLIISDFHWARIDPEAASLIEKAVNRGMRVFAVAVGRNQGEFRLPLRSTFAFRYEDGRILEEGW